MPNWSLSCKRKARFWKFVYWNRATEITVEKAAAAATHSELETSKRVAIMLLCDPICPLKMLCNIRNSVSRWASTLFPLYTSDNSSFASGVSEKTRRKIKTIKFMSSRDSINQIIIPSMALRSLKTLNVRGVCQLPSAPSSTERRWKCFEASSVKRERRDAGRVERLRTNVVRIFMRTNIKVETVNGRYLRNNK